tara:strand:+ start:1429 stop:1638 length:210 start_codon:yes stop_codon:yes gene_type:complete
MTENIFQKGEKVWYTKDNKVYEAEIKIIHYDDKVPYYTIYIPETKIEKQTIINRLFKSNNLFEAIKHVL